MANTQNQSVKYPGDNSQYGDELWDNRKPFPLWFKANFLRHTSHQVCIEIASDCWIVDRSKLRKIQGINVNKYIRPPDMRISMLHQS